MARTSDSFQRKGPLYKPQPKILVICEDKKSGLQYLKDATKYYRVNVQVEVLHVGYTDPLGIISHGVKVQSSYDHIYFMIDRDDHKNFHAAIAATKYEAKLTPVISNPCFEFWLYLHFKYSRKPYRAAGNKSSADQLIEDLKKIPEMEGYVKGDINGLFGLLEEYLDKAKKRSIALMEEANTDGEFNPSTEIHLLLEAFNKLSSPTVID